MFINIQFFCFENEKTTNSWTELKNKNKNTQKFNKNHQHQQKHGSFSVRFYANKTMYRQTHQEHQIEHQNRVDLL